MITVDDLVKIDQYIDRKEMSEKTDIHYQTLAGKINRRKKGKNPRLSLEQSKAIKEYLYDLHDTLVMILSD